MSTIIPFGDPKAVKRWSAALFADIAKKSYFEKKFTGTTQNSVIQRLTELDNGAGDRIHFDLSVQLRGEPVYGDARAQGTEENLRFYSDEVIIDQVRHPVSMGGKMTRKRTAHNLRAVAKSRLSEYFARLIDEWTFIYLSGARGVNRDYIVNAQWQGHANNPIQSPDPGHQMYGGNAISKATLTKEDTMSRLVIEKAVTRAKTLSSEDADNSHMVPVDIDGESHYVCVMHPFQEHQLRASDKAGWLEIQKAAASAEGRANPIFKGGLGMINNVVLHSHKNAICFRDGGAGQDLPTARALFMGRQAGVVAYGSDGGLRYEWVEEKVDYNNEHVVVSGSIIGIKKTRFNSRDFGVMALDTYAADPTK